MVRLDDSICKHFRDKFRYGGLLVVGLSIGLDI